MKSSIVPAQITSVEDRIAGSFSLTQIMLLLSCVFVCVLVYSVLPPENLFEGYKIPLIGIIIFVFVVCSWRVRGKLLLQWFVIMASFLLRPRRYVFNKNSKYYRETVHMDLDSLVNTTVVKSIEDDRYDHSIDKKRINHLLDDPQVSVRFTFGKGGLRVKATKLST